MLKRRNIIIIVISLACCVALAMFYATAYRSHILWQEQNQIFLNTSHWIATYFSKPAWLGCLSGDWLTQYFHNPAAGAVILTRYCLLHSVFWNRCAPHVSGDCHIRSVVSFCNPAYRLLDDGIDNNEFLYVCGRGLTLGLARVQIRYGKKHGLDISPLLVIPAYWAFGFGALISAAFMIAFSSRRALQNRGTGACGSLRCARLFCRRHAGCAMWLFMPCLMQRVCFIPEYPSRPFLILNMRSALQ